MANLSLVRGLEATPASRPASYQSSGFTLAEVLVVSVIVAILAAVAIPVYTNYLQDQRAEAVDNLANTAAVAAFAYYKRTGDLPDDFADLNMFLPDASYTITIAGENVTVTNADGLSRTVDFIP